MAFFDEVGKFAKTVAGKTGEMVDITRLNSKIGTLKNEISGLKQQIGEHYWSKFEAGAPCDPELSGVCDEIKNRMAAIASVEAEIAAIRGSGAQSAQSAQAAFCPSCGAKLTPGVKFCGGCGAKL
jgi:uncharacterized small protein (DUF1192 family)